jgi:hypothetical protein
MKEVKAGLQDQLKNYQGFLELTQKLEALAAQRDFGGMPPVLIRRGKILEKIFAREETLLQRWPALTPREQKELFPALEAIKKIQEEIAARNRMIGSQCRTEKDQIQERLARIGHGRKALHGYLPHRLGIPRYFDKQG